MNKTLSYLTQKLLFVALLLVGFAACSQVDVNLGDGPKGEQGDQGAKGKDAISMYQLWKDAVLNGDITKGVNKENVELTDFFLYLRGEKGEDGKTVYELWKDALASGQVTKPSDGSIWNSDNSTLQDFFTFLTGAKGGNGSAPTIKDGKWYLGDKPILVDGQPVQAVGVDGYSAEAPVISIDENGNWQVTTKDPATGKETVTPLNVRAKANDGTTPTITIDPTTKNWKVNGVDTGIKAEGKNGNTTPVGLSSDGYWMIDGKKTTYPAFGPKGDNGVNGPDGKNAYEVWVEMVSKGDVQDPHSEEGVMWPKERTSKSDFWEYLRGTDGRPGESAEQVIEKGKYNVISAFYQQELGERVSPKDGRVTFNVYNKEGAPAVNAKVKGLPGMPPDKEYQADAEGKFTIDNKDLPDALHFKDRIGSCEVVHAGATHVTAANTVVPNKVNVRLVYNSSKAVNNYSSTSEGTGSNYVSIYAKVERQLNGGKWQTYPNELSSVRPSIGLVWIKDPNKKATEKGNYFRTQAIPEAEHRSNYVKSLFSGYTSSGVSASFSVSRPIIIPEDQQKYKTHRLYSKLKDREWDGKDVAFSIYASTNIYGNDTLRNDTSVIVKEVYPAPDYDIKGVQVVQGTISIFGQIDSPENSLKTYTYAYSAGAPKSEGGNYPSYVLAPTEETVEDRLKIKDYFEIVSIYNDKGRVIKAGSRINGKTYSKEEYDRNFIIEGIQESAFILLQGQSFSGRYRDNFKYTVIEDKSTPGQWKIVSTFDHKNEIKVVKQVSEIPEEYKQKKTN